MKNCSQGDVYVYQAGRQDGSDELWLPVSAFDGCPRWSPLNQEPPISISEAVKIAENFHHDKRIAIHHIALVRAWDERLNSLDKPHEPGIWHYVVSGAFVESRSSPYGFTLIVLMNRNTYEPSLIPWEQRGRAPEDEA